MKIGGSTSPILRSPTGVGLTSTAQVGDYLALCISKQLEKILSVFHKVMISIKVLAMPIALI